jgi:hypothetical protein
MWFEIAHLIQRFGDPSLHYQENKNNLKEKVVLSIFLFSLYSGSFGGIKFFFLTKFIYLVHFRANYNLEPQSFGSFWFIW